MKHLFVTFSVFSAMLPTAKLSKLSPAKILSLRLKICLKNSILNTEIEKKNKRQNYWMIYYDAVKPIFKKMRSSYFWSVLWACLVGSDKPISRKPLLISYHPAVCGLRSQSAGVPDYLYITLLRLGLVASVLRLIGYTYTTKS